MTGPFELLAALPIPAAAVTASLEVAASTRAFAGLVGADAADLAAVGRSLRQATALGDPLARAVARLRTPGWTTEFRWEADGGNAVFNVKVTRADDAHFLVVLEELSQLLQLDAIQRQARGYLEAVLNHLRLAVIVLDGDFSITFFNRDQASLFKRLGVEAGLLELVGTPVASAYPLFCREEWDGILARVVRAGETVEWARLPYPPQSPTTTFSVTFVPIEPSPMSSGGAICITEDVSRMVALENALVRKERLALVGQMAIALNHEINNPLTTILGTAESLLLREDLGEGMTPRIDLVKSSALRIAEVTARLRGIEEIHLTEYVQGGPLMLDLTKRPAGRGQG